MKFGICCGPGSFVPQSKDAPVSDPAALLSLLEHAGADYVEFPVNAVMSLKSELEFEQLQSVVVTSRLRVEAFNSFLPGSMRITGPDVHLNQVLNYCATAFRRCRALGGEVVVLGSAGARKVPEGFDPGEAERQFVEFCTQLGPVARESGITVAIEPLNRKEDNLVLSVEHGIRLVDQVGDPNIQLLADLYHMAEERESVEVVARAGKRLRHTHCADRTRAAPGFALEGEEDFLGFFRNLRAAAYDSRCSFEGRTEDLKKQAAPLLELLRRRWLESGLS